MRNTVFTFVVLAVTVAVSHSAEEKFNKTALLELMSQLPKNAITQLQSTLKNELEGQNLSSACLMKVLKLTTTELAQAFPSKFSSYVCVVSFSFHLFIDESYIQLCNHNSPVAIGYQFFATPGMFFAFFLLLHYRCS